MEELVREKNGGKPVKVVANLPYYITTPIIMQLFESHVPLESITIMVQTEVAERMQVGPGTKDYGALSLAVQYYSRPEIVTHVPPSCFMPRPNVGSTVIRLRIYVQTDPRVLQPAQKNACERTEQCVRPESYEGGGHGCIGKNGTACHDTRGNLYPGTICPSWQPFI